MHTERERLRCIGSVGLMLSCGAALGVAATLVTDARGNPSVEPPRHAIVSRLRAQVRSGAPEGFYLRLDYEIRPQRRAGGAVVPAIEAACLVGERTHVAVVPREQVRAAPGRTITESAWLWAREEGTLPGAPARCVISFRGAGDTSFCFTPPAHVSRGACDS